MVSKGLSVRGLHRFLSQTPDLLAAQVAHIIPFPESKIPHKRTFDRRLKKLTLSLQLYMLCVARVLHERFKLGLARLAVDNRMFPAVGAIWHKKDQVKGNIPEGLRNVDTAAGWGCSAYRGWIFGHALELIVTTGKLVVPVVALGRSLKIRGNTALKTFVHRLPVVNKGVLAADSEYFDQVLAKQVAKTGRSLHAPSKRNPEQTPKSKTYQRRKVSVEPCFERLLLAFTNRGKLEYKGPQAWPRLMIGVFIYQLMVLMNLIEKAANPLEVTHLIRMLFFVKELKLFSIGGKEKLVYYLCPTFI
jgi:hypothetical protein